VEPEVFLLEFRTLGTGLQVVQEIELRIATRSGENEAAGFVE
jgi:hypothetical protein